MIDESGGNGRIRVRYFSRDAALRGMERGSGIAGLGIVMVGVWGIIMMNWELLGLGGRM